MALKPCRECRAQVSTEAKSCPHCGVKSPTVSRLGQEIRKAIRGIATLVILVSIALVLAVNNFSGNHDRATVASVEEAATPAAADVASNNPQAAATPADKPAQATAPSPAGEQRAPSGDARAKAKRAVNGAREAQALEAADVSRSDLKITADEPKLTLDQASNLLTHCIKPEVQYGMYSSFEVGELTGKILQGACNRELLDFIDTCAAGDKNSEERCLSSAVTTAHEAIASFGQ
jgi:hypothetical protein